MRQQVGGGAGNHQLADEIDELIKLVGVHAHELRFLGLALADLPLFDHCRRDDFRVHHFLVDQDLAQRVGGRRVLGRLALRFVVLRVQSLVEFGLCERTAAHQDFPQAHGVFRQFLDVFDVFGQLAVGRQDAQVAFVAHEIEDAFDVGLGGARLQADFEAQVTRFRVHLGGRRHGIGERFDAQDLAQAAQVADEGQRFHAAAQHVLAETHRDVPGIGQHHPAARALQVIARLLRHHVGPGCRCRAGGQDVFEPRRQRRALGREGRVRGLSARGQHVDQSGHVVAAFEQHGGQLQRDGNIAVAQGVQDVFHVVGKRLDVVAFHDAGAALDGVGDAEDAVDVVAIVRRLFQAQQTGLHCNQQFAAFLNEYAGDVVVHVGLSPSRSGVRGRCRRGGSRGRRTGPPYCRSRSRCSPPGCARRCAPSCLPVALRS